MENAIVNIIPNNILKELSMHGEKFAPEFGSRNLSNHYPMALIALLRIAGSEKQLGSFSKSYIGNLDRNTSQKSIVITDENFRLLLGKRKAYVGYYNYFRDRLTKFSLASELERLTPGVAAGAFHALIRIAYGVDAGIPSEVVSGLAYLADAYQEVVSTAENNFSSLDRSYTHLYRQVLAWYTAGDLDMPELDGVIFEKMSTVASEGTLQKLISEAYLAPELSLRELAKCNLDLFLRTGNFTALHTVTAAHAARTLSEAGHTSTQLVKYLAASSINALLTIPADQFSRQPFKMEAPISISGILECARASKDDHDIKFAYTCVCEYKHYRDPDYLNALALRFHDQ